MNQQTFAIRWDILSQDVLDFLDRVGVERSPSGVHFTRPPSWDDFTLVVAYLVGLETSTAQKGNHVGFAIGDALNEGKELFGHAQVDQWIEEFLELRTLRDTTLMAAGGTMVLLQQVEQQITLACSLIPLRELNLTLEDFFNPDARRRRHTLGQIAHALKKRDIFTGAFEERLSKFVEARNGFIHGLFVSQPKVQPTRSGLPSREEYEQVLDFVSRLGKDAREVQNVFRGMQYALTHGHQKPSTSGHTRNSALTSWVKYLPLFKEALKDPGEEEAA